MDAPGRGTAGSRGDAAISVQLGGVSSTVYVVVVPEGTYRLSGVVRTADAAGDLVFGARVDALDLPERLETTTDPQGRYVLFGVPGAVRIRITRAGYITSEDTIQLTDHQSVDFALTLSEPLPDISGTYTLRITLVTPCGDPDPGSEFRDRTYTATVTHSSRRSVRVRLTGADLVVSRGRGDGFSGSVDPSGATFFIDEDFYLYSYPEIVERLPNGRYFVVGGHVSTKKAPEGLVGTMSGLMIFYDGPPTQSRVIAWCLSDDIRFALLK